MARTPQTHSSIAVPEGEEKPLKYPGIFFKSKAMIITKVDLLPYVPFRLDDAIANARSVQPAIEILQVSATSGVGMDDWLRWLERR